MHDDRGDVGRQVAQELGVEKSILYRSHVTRKTEREATRKRKRMHTEKGRSIKERESVTRRRYRQEMAVDEVEAGNGGGKRK